MFDQDRDVWIRSLLLTMRQERANSPNFFIEIDFSDSKQMLFSTERDDNGELIPYDIFEVTGAWGNYDRDIGEMELVIETTPCHLFAVGNIQDRGALFTNVPTKLVLKLAPYNYRLSRCYDLFPERKLRLYEGYGEVIFQTDTYLKRDGYPGSPAIYTNDMEMRINVYFADGENIINYEE